MPTAEEIVTLLSRFHQAVVARAVAAMHDDEKLEIRWGSIQSQRARELLTSLLGREPLRKELDEVLSPPYPEPPYDD
jgi:hypothetical protein